MTKTLFIINIKEIKTAKVSCQECGFSVIFPVDSGYRKITECINCNVKFPVSEIKTWLEATKFLQAALKENGSFPQVVIEIETEVKN